MKSLPAPLQALIEGVKPMPLVKNVGSVAAGFLAAQLGGRLVKHIDAVEHFASGGAIQEVIVDLGAGLAIDAVILAGVGAVGGVDLAFKVGKLVVVGTLIGALLPVVAQHIADGIEHVVDMVFGTKAIASTSTDTSTAPAPAGELYAHTNRHRMRGMGSRGGVGGFHTRRIFGRVAA